MAVQPSGAPAVRRYGLRGFPRLPDPYAEVNRERRRIMRLFGHTRRDDVDFYWLRNPARSGRLTAMRPNEPETAPSRVQDLGQTNPSHCRHAGISPNEPEAVQADEHHFGQTNPSPISRRTLSWPNKPKPERPTRTGLKPAATCAQLPSWPNKPEQQRSAVNLLA
jgi:hypothetical protein